MMKRKRIGWTTGSLISQCLAWAQAQELPASGLYQITAGNYSECCGFTGDPSDYPLPDTFQTYIELAVDSEKNIAQMAFLAEDRNTVFSPAGPGAEFRFIFANGMILSNRIQFESAIQTPEDPNWSYTVSNSAGGLRIDGIAIAPPWGFDIPNKFQHANIVAVLAHAAFKPTLGLPHISSGGGIQFTIINGLWGQTNVVEGSDDLVTWTAISTNVFPFTSCPICPFIDLQDPGSANFVLRFYRSFSVP